MNQKNSLIGLLMLAVGIVGYASGQSQKVPAESKVTTSPERLRVTGEFEFEVVECFDAKYLGDVPGYVGRHGECQRTQLEPRPRKPGDRIRARPKHTRQCGRRRISEIRQIVAKRAF